MNGKADVRFFKVKTLPTRWEPNSFYYVLDVTTNAYTEYITDHNGEPKQTFIPDSRLNWQTKEW